MCTTVSQKKNSIISQIENPIITFHSHKLMEMGKSPLAGLMTQKRQSIATHSAIYIVARWPTWEYSELNVNTS